MNTTIRTIANDLLTSFKQTNPEKNITLVQAVFWAAHLVNLLKAKHIQKRNSNLFLNVFPEVEIKTATAASTGIVPGRKYIDLPAGIFDFNNDEGINYIAYNHESDIKGRPGFSINPFTRTTASEAKRLYMNEFEKPSLFNPYFYIINSRVYFLGLETFYGDSLEMGLFTTVDPLGEIDIDAPLQFPDELVPVLTRQLYDLGRFAMLIPKDFKNDSINEEPAESLRGQRTVSVNDPNIQQVD